MKKLLIIASLILSPTFVFAAPPRTFAELVGLLLDILSDVFTLLMGGLLFFFLFGLARFIFASGDEKAIEQGKRFMLWGILALFIAFSIWGFVGILSNTFLK